MSVKPVSVAILAGGQSDRFKSSKALAPVAGKPLFLHVIDACAAYSDEIFVVVHSEAERKQFSAHYPKELIITDIASDIRSPLVGALTAFGHAQNPYTQLLPCDSPLIHEMFFEIMWSMVDNHNAAVPRWPNGWIEPLHSVFATEIAKEVAAQCLKDQKPRMQCLIKNIGWVIYLSTNALERFDPKLLTFTNVNTPTDLYRIERSLRRQPQR
jgi:molybdopterin-guanine dinucleotide biosynthesis protein A